MKQISIKKFIMIIGCMTMGITLIYGCKKQAPNSMPIETIESNMQTPAPTIEPTPLTTPIPESLVGKAQSKISGLWIDEELVKLRPYAVMFNNIQYASPQSGISQASVLYEAIVEGGITRLMGIFEEFDSDRIGSTRSARHYFVSFADEYDAIYVHFGQTKYATKKMADLGIDNLSGLEGVGNTVFYRDNTIKAPHNAFASYQGILAGIKQKKYRTELKEDYENHYNFYNTDTDMLEETKASKVTLGFSKYTTPYFTYNMEDKLYYRYQFGKEHIDKNTGKQLAFKNIIIQLVKEWDIDKNDYQTMDIENSSGNGYYITNGNAVEITWKKNEATKKMHYYDKNGEILTVNPGKTYIAVFPKDRIEQISISE